MGKWVHLSSIIFLYNILQLIPNFKSLKNMEHFIFSIYYDNLNPEIKDYQKKVFNYFNLSIEQIKVQNDCLELPEILNKNSNWDIVTIFDIDCIPLIPNIFDKYFKLENFRDTLYGNAQASNVFSGEIKSPPYVSPHFMTFSRKLWNHLYDILGNDAFVPKRYPNPNGVETQADRAEVFTIEAQKLGYTTKIEYPTNVEIPKWTYGGEFGENPFTFGIGTTYGDLTYHNYEIRDEHNQQFFISKCKSIIENSSISNI